MQKAAGNAGKKWQHHVKQTLEAEYVEEELREIEVKEVNEEADRNNGSDIIKFDDRRRKAD